MPLELHVRTTGNDDNPGTLELPLASLRGACDRLRSLRDDPNAVEGAVVLVQGGTYPITETLVLGKEDGGTQEAPVVIQAVPGETVTLQGGITLPRESFSPVTDEGILNRLLPEVRSAVQVIDLEVLGLKVPLLPNAAELACGDLPLMQARWPKAGYAKIAAAPNDLESQDDRSFCYEGDRPRRWQDNRDTWLHVWGNEWHTTRTAIDAIDVEKCQIKVPQPVQYGLSPGGRYFCFNILEEL
ncbi:MAG: hypothetical protein ACYTGH_17990, partial [Planctomycetota bacterium]